MPRIRSNPLTLWPAIVGLVLLAPIRNAPGSEQTPAPEVKAERGFKLLISKHFSSTALTVDELDRLWTVWEPGPRAKAEAASPEERRRMAFLRYGLIERDFDSTGLPLGYTDDGRGNLAANCFSCHGGKVAGKPWPGLPNTHQDIEGLVRDLGALRAADRGEKGSNGAWSVPIPLNFSRGVTNATMFSIVLGAMRDADLNRVFPELAQKLVNNDMDAPPWWHYKKKKKIYCDAFTPPSTRALMQFAMSPTISGEELRSWEGDFEFIQAYIEHVQPPPYPFEIDRKTADKGREVFLETCSRCHGTYGPEDSYPNKVIPIWDIGTDATRLGAIARESKEKFNRSWFAYYGERPVDLRVKGYLAQPLDGIWATAPYLHNGSVPTIDHLFNPATRPRVWKRTENGYDRERVGLEVEELDAVPEGLTPREQRMYYDTQTPSHGNWGHPYPDDELTTEEKRWVIEYLKTL